MTTTRTKTKVVLSICEKMVGWMDIHVDTSRSLDHEMKDSRRFHWTSPLQLSCFALIEPAMILNLSDILRIKLKRTAMLLPHSPKAWFSKCLTSW